MLTELASSKTTIYVAAIVILSITTAASVLFIIFLRPDKDNTITIATVVGIFTPVVFTLMALMGHENHLSLNSRLTQLLDITASSSRAEGKLIGLMMSVPGADSTVEKILATIKEHDAWERDDRDVKIANARAEGIAKGIEQERLRTEGGK